MALCSIITLPSGLCRKGLSVLGSGERVDSVSMIWSALAPLGLAVVAVVSQPILLLVALSVLVE